jgi:hypothetical protein
MFQFRHFGTPTSRLMNTLHCMIPKPANTEYEGGPRRHVKHVGNDGTTESRKNMELDHKIATYETLPHDGTSGTWTKAGASVWTHANDCAKTSA